MAGNAVMDDPHYTTPLYHKAEAAHIIAVPAQTFRDWAVGYARKRLDGSQLVSAPIVTTLEPSRPQGVSVPFVGLAEASSWRRSPRPGFRCGVYVLRFCARPVHADRGWDVSIREGFESYIRSLRIVLGVFLHQPDRDTLVAKLIWNVDTHRFSRSRTLAPKAAEYHVSGKHY